MSIPLLIHGLVYQADQLELTAFDLQQHHNYFSLGHQLFSYVSKEKNGVADDSDNIRDSNSVKDKNAENRSKDISNSRNANLVKDMNGIIWPSMRLVLYSGTNLNFFNNPFMLQNLSSQSDLVNQINTALSNNTQ